MTRLTHIATSLLTVLLLGLVACSDNSCYENGSSLPLATLYMGNSQQDISGLSVMGIGVPGDSLLVNSTAVDEVYLPLRASTTTTSFALWHTVSIDTTNVVVRDTLTIDYKAIPFFESDECGAMYNFDIQQVTHTVHGIDSVVVLNTLITNARTPSMRIYFTDFSQ